jgi:hypothetical protein
MHNRRGEVFQGEAAAKKIFRVASSTGFARSIHRISTAVFA